MMNTIATQEPFVLAHHLIGLTGVESAARLPFRMPPRDASIDRILGVVEAGDDAAVHSDVWEIHPGGDEILCVLSGCLRVTLAPDGQQEVAVDVIAGEAFIVPRATWHRLQVIAPARLLFCTPGDGTNMRRHEDVNDQDRPSRGASDAQATGAENLR